MMGEATADRLLELVRTGNDEYRDQLIADHLSLIKRTVRLFTRSFWVEDRDEYSIALQAFNLAIDRYQAGSPVPFANYARLLMKNRLIDWYRRCRSCPATVSLSDDEAGDGIPLADRLSDPRSEHVQQDLEYADAAMRVQLQLQAFGLSLAQAVARFPVHSDSKRLCMRLAVLLEQDEPLYSRLLQTRRLPTRDLALLSQVPQKTIERNRTSIILLAVLMRSDLEQFRTYIAAYMKEVSP
jgi:RNA polymerase sigma factor